MDFLFSRLFVAFLTIHALLGVAASDNEAYGADKAPLDMQQGYLKTLEIVKGKYPYAIQLQFPRLGTLNISESNRLWIRTELKKLLRNVRRNFIHEVRSSTELHLVRREEDLSRLNGDCKLSFNSPELISIYCNFQSYRSDGSPMHFTEALNLNLLQHSSIALADIFSESNFAKALALISAYSRVELNNSLQEDDLSAGISDWIRTGTEPTVVNFKTFSIYKEGVKLFFPEYQVAAYAFGPQEVLVPWSVLKDTVN